MADTLTRDVEIIVADDPDPMMQLFGGAVLGVNNLKPSGVVVRYGINTIPYATLDLTPRDLPLICDLELHRRAPIRIQINSKHGCLVFKGLIDGSSISHSVGDMRMQLIVKSPFQLLNEINPKLLGYHSSGVDFTRRVEALTIQKQNDQYKTLTMAIASVAHMNLTKPFIEGILEVLKAVITSQINWRYILSVTGPSGQAAVQAAQAMGQVHLEIAMVLLNSIDTSYVPTSLTLADYFTSNLVLENICESRNNLWEIFLSLLELAGCALVVANTKAFVVPNSGFLKQSHKAYIQPQEYSTIPNILYPVQYNSLNFNDNGYKDISGVYIQADDRNRSGVDGFFKDVRSGGKGGIIGETMPYVINFNNAATQAAKSRAASKAVGEARPHTKPLMSEEEFNKFQEGSSVGQTPKSYESYVKSEEGQHAVINADSSNDDKAVAAYTEDTNAANQEAIDKIKFLADQWAQLSYYRLKYTDRMGGISTMFNPNFAPGCVGSVYLRYPGVYIDFFVTEVTHEIRVAAPDTGIASTNIIFNCGRMGSLTSSLLSAGLDSFNLFENYDATRSYELAAAYVSDIKASQ